MTLNEMLQQAAEQIAKTPPRLIVCKQCDHMTDRASGLCVHCDPQARREIHESVARDRKVMDKQLNHAEQHGE